MIEKVKLNEVAKDLNISGKDLTALLQERFGGEAKKPQTVLSGEELNFVMEHYTQQHAVKDFGEYFKLGEKKPAPAAAPKPAEKPAEKPVEKAAPAPSSRLPMARAKTVPSRGITAPSRGITARRATAGLRITVRRATAALRTTAIIIGPRATACGPI